MSFKKFIIYSQEEDVYCFDWSSKIEGFTIITSVNIREFIINIFNKRINRIRLHKLIGWLKGEIRTEYIENKNGFNALFTFNSNKFEKTFPKSLFIDDIYAKHSTNLYRFVSLIELEILKQCPLNKNLLLISDCIKKVSSKNIYLIVIYSSGQKKDILQKTAADYYVDFSLKDWSELTIKILLSKLKNKSVSKYFPIIDYERFFANQKTNAQIEKIRDYIHPKSIDIAASSHYPFDQFDLEIQTLISSTWLERDDLYLGSNKKLNYKTLDTLIFEQLSVILDRYKNFNNKLPVRKLLTPDGIFQSKTRYWYDKNRIYAVPVRNGFINKSKAIEVEFKEVDSEMAANYERCFHYIHNNRHFSTAFGLFIRDEKFPYAISILDFLGYRSIDYKIKFLNQAGINQEQCVDEIRLYSLPWAPMLTSSLLAELVRKHLIVNFPNITTSITAVNRNLFKGIYIIQAGYIPLALKPTTFNYGEISINNKLIKFYQGSAGRPPTNSPFLLLPTVEYYRSIKKAVNVNKPQGKVLVIPRV
ncbi:hypothetical protein COT03_01640 [Candidatus Shapirobacteria bacterium CG07_land_8_20_14_0_80_39_18]|uniref:Uncharacterized protein n=1 Tax=Candidatus Shapirobacteria bacterium CG07_land_8_20_14_0_80_39_18 TaxID=1974882 RepID=A0A2M6YRB9_9BACT|nr:MAG: hypothetical protein COT03_01640 [Candidatus Shapirobacteria bacterium CG07_land_8_20_14_0_80_39_18]